jgi:uncharacterized protein DUF1684
MISRRERAWPRMRLGPTALAVAVLAQPLHSQAPPQLTAERRAFSEWLGQSPTSPTAILARTPVGPGLSVGPASADLPLPGISGRVAETGGRIVFTDTAGPHTVPRSGTVRIASYLLSASGPPGRGILLVYGVNHTPTQVSWYPYDSGFVFTVDLKGPAVPPRRLRLDADATEVEALDVGTVTVPLGGMGATLTVYEMGGGDDPESSDLTVYFQDRTNGHGSYPAGRFIELVPTAGGRYRLDFNRARNPYCAYSTIYPCPAPWPGNLIDAPVSAGERYAPSGGEPAR